MIGLRATSFARKSSAMRSMSVAGRARGASSSVLTRANVPQRPDGGTRISRLAAECPHRSLGWSHGCTPALPQRRALRAQHGQERGRDRHRQAAGRLGASCARPGPKHGGLGSGVEGDFLGDTRHHGGDYQAVYAFAREELDWWADALGRELPNGMFGENLTTSRPRRRRGPASASAGRSATRSCSRSAARGSRARRSRPGWASAAGSSGSREVGRTGAYLSVVTGGHGAAGRRRSRWWPDRTTTSPCRTRSGRSWVTSTSPNASWPPTASSRSRRPSCARRSPRRPALTRSRGWRPVDACTLSTLAGCANGSGDSAPGGGAPGARAGVQGRRTARSRRGPLRGMPRGRLASSPPDAADSTASRAATSSGVASPRTSRSGGRSGVRASDPEPSSLTGGCSRASWAAGSRAWCAAPAGPW